MANRQRDPKISEFRVMSTAHEIGQNIAQWLIRWDGVRAMLTVVCSNIWRFWKLLYLNIKTKLCYIVLDNILHRFSIICMNLYFICTLINNDIYKWLRLFLYSKFKLIKILAAQNNHYHIWLKIWGCGSFFNKRRCAAATSYPGPYLRSGDKALGTRLAQL